MASRFDAEQLAAKLTGGQPEKAALDMIISGARIGDRDDDSDDPDDDLDGEDQDEDQSEEQDTDPNDGEDDDASDGESQEDADEDDTSSEDDDGDEGYDTAEYSEDDIFEVVVDGERKDVTLKQLLQRYSGEGAIEKRLQEATELRKAANAEREAVTNEIETHRTNLLQTIAKLDQVLFMPLVRKPDPALRQKNMQEYLLQQDAYQEDQQRIQSLRTNLSEMFVAEQQKSTATREAFRKAQGELLAKAAPELRDPKTAALFQDDLMTAVQHYGFTQAHLQEVDNHALFLMARDAGRWIKMQRAKDTVSNKTSPTVGADKKRRRLKPGGATANAKAVQGAKVVKIATAKARKTGTVDDVANMLVANATAKHKRS